jgi:hypothetical protein
VLPFLALLSLLSSFCPLFSLRNLFAGRLPNGTSEQHTQRNIKAAVQSAVRILCVGGYEKGRLPLEFPEMSQIIKAFVMYVPIHVKHDVVGILW